MAYVGRIIVVALLVFVCVVSAGQRTTLATGTARNVASILPNAWLLARPAGMVTSTGTMPQGAALSPDGTLFAVVESGFKPPALSLYAARDAHRVRRITLTGAFGRPAWMGGRVFVAGANADAVFEIDPRDGSVRKIPLAAKSYPLAVAARDGVVAVATDGDGALRTARPDELSATRPVRIGHRPGGIAFSADGSRVFVALRAGSAVAAVSLLDGTVRHIATALHPSDVLVRGRTVFVAEADADSVGIYDAGTGRRLATVNVGEAGVPKQAIGASPNALAARGDRVYVSLGAANQIAVIQGRRVVARIPTGWYPTDIVPAPNGLFVVDGKGEGTKPNPQFDFRSTNNVGYVAAMQYGSIRALRDSIAQTPPAGVPRPQSPPVQTVIRRNGPIAHVFFILKENRSYDQVLGDMAQGNGDPKLTWFGEKVTPNQHALARRFGLFDNAYTSGEVSDAGHNWSDGAFANDYVERFWPLTYGGRRDIDDLVAGAGPAVPARGYLWDAASRAHVSFRDYGELTPPGPTAPSLRHRFDERYIGWNLNYSDLDRVKEWQREFDAFVRTGTLPQFEYIWLPNDHTYGSRRGKLTPAAYVAQNDYAVGLLVATLSHSRVWRSSAVFIIEDDSQDGADHVSDQRTTLYIASPYARGGVQHAHYSTLSVLSTLERVLGMEPLSAYDATAAPMYDAFALTPRLAAFDAIAPRIDITARNAKVAFGGALSDRADFDRPDATLPGFLRTVLAYNHGASRVR
jgi:DNA-binding beta-propeller fold protein YncE